MNWTEFIELGNLQTFCFYLGAQRCVYTFKTKATIGEMGQDLVPPSNVILRVMLLKTRKKKSTPHLKHWLCCFHCLFHWLLSYITKSSRFHYWCICCSGVRGTLRAEKGWHMYTFSFNIQIKTPYWLILHRLQHVSSL